MSNPPTPPLPPSSPPPAPASPRSETARIERLEEAASYTDRTVEQLSGEIAELNKRLQSMGKRMSMLEAALRKLQQPGDEEASDQGDDDSGG